MKFVCKRVATVPFFLLAIGMLVGASIWEGTAVVAPDGVLPDAGYYAAANSFPKDTEVIVTNLENGKFVHVTVVATLDNSSVLMLLSKEAADAIALSASYPGRVRVMEAIDPITMLPPLENKISNGDPDYDPMARINAIPPDSLAEEAAPDAEAPEGEPPVLAEEAAPDAEAPEGEPPVLAEEVAPDAEAPGEEVAVAPEGEPPAPEGEAAPAKPEAPSPVIYSEDYELALVPAEKRAPEGKGVDIPLDEQVSPIATRQEQERSPDPAGFITSIEDALTSAPSQPQGGAPGAPTNFSVPMIAGMEKGMYYVQLRSYSRPELVESELVKIGRQHNVAVQVTELSGKQLYRILIGPVSFSESAQLLQQYKARGWSDAFVWIGK